jgi:predicted acylesterase/phospholipase RssA
MPNQAATESSRGLEIDLFCQLSVLPSSNLTKSIGKNESDNRLLACRVFVFNIQWTVVNVIPWPLLASRSFSKMSMNKTLETSCSPDHSAVLQQVDDKNSATRADAERAHEKSPFDELPSLAAYFKDYSTIAKSQKCDSDWLRDRANAILNDQAGNPECLYKFAKRWLSERLMFGPAAKILSLALANYRGENRLFLNLLRQQLAVATYKNEEAPTRKRLEAALAVLENVPSLIGATGMAPDDGLADQAETWALHGAVYRRLADLDGKLRYLYQALDCYRRSNELDSQRDDCHVTGYGALNAAFLLDSLAFHLEFIGDGPILKDGAKKARDESAALRIGIIDRLGKRLAISGHNQEEWLCETIAGAYLALSLARWTAERSAAPPIAGIEPADELLRKARAWAEKAIQQRRADWKLETTHTQWVRVAYLNEPRGAAREVLESYWAAAASVINPFRKRSCGVELSAWEMAGNARRGKVGLALSGGGFRASFYHLGVLARLAEVDALRHIDVLSTVSGGSIVGAHYYLLLRRLLEEKENPTRDEYIDLVERLQQQFCLGVNKNLRMRGLSNPSVTLKLLLKRNYTRSNRMAELYDEQLFAQTDEGGDTRFPLASLRIRPQGESDSFNPRFSNWRRSARVPALLINATCLNTGHSWHFTANWMGEPPELIGSTVDKNERLRRVPYQKAPGYESLSLGFAVAASACVPGIFEPLRLPGLYPGRLVRLVDGGVHDNQGVDALVGQGCDFILCSDGSGQVGDEMRPSNGPVGTPKRSMNILMKRVREAEHADIADRVISGTRRGLLFVHLKSELPVDDINWVRCDDPTQNQAREPLSYGIDHEIQRRLSDIRTDLDSFSEVEAYALMTSGYAMTRAELERLNKELTSRGDTYPWGGFDVTAPTERTRWRFLRLDAKMAVTPDANDIVRKDLGTQLRVGQSLFFKQIKLMPWLFSGLFVGVLVAMGVIVGTLSCHFDGVRGWLVSNGVSPSYGAIIATMVTISLVSAIPPIRIWCIESLFAVFGLLTSNLYFWCGLNKMFLARGRLERLLNLK